jgi:uncharacterized protein (TIGR02300 family)
MGFANPTLRSQSEDKVAKPELGTKRQCPKCGTRFYDLGKSDPITCINCSHTFLPEAILKPRRPVAEVVEEKKVVKAPVADADDEDILEDDDGDMDSILEIEDEEDDIDVEVEVDVEDDSDDDK